MSMAKSRKTAKPKRPPPPPVPRTPTPEPLSIHSSPEPSTIMDRPSLYSYTIQGREITRLLKKLEHCEDELDYTIYAINELLKAKSGLVMSIMDSYKDVKRLIQPKTLEDGWNVAPAKWDVQGTQHQAAIAGYLFFEKPNVAAPGNNVLEIEQHDGPAVELPKIECTACLNKKSGGPMQECIAMNVDGHDFLKGGCLNCYYKLGISSCSLAKKAKQDEKKRKLEEAGGFGGITSKMLENATDEELKSVLRVIDKRLEHLAEEKEDDESPTKKQKRKK